MVKPRKGLGGALCSLIRRFFPNNFSEEARETESYKTLEETLVHSEALTENTERDKLLAEQRYRKQLFQQGEELQTAYAEIDAGRQAFDELEAENLGLKSTNLELKTENSQVREAAKKVKEHSLRVLKNSRELANLREVQAGKIAAIYAREIGKRDYSQALFEWQQFSEKKLKEKAEDAEAAAHAYRREAFGGIVDFAIAKFPRVPFAYYDFSNGKLLYTQTVPEFLNINQENKSERITLRTLLRYVCREDRPVLIEALREGERLKHYKTQSSGENPSKLILTTHPYFYEDKDSDVKRVLGVGIFLYDPIISLKKIGVYRLAKNLEEALDFARERFDGIKERAIESAKKPKPIPIPVHEL